MSDAPAQSTRDPREVLTCPNCDNRAERSTFPLAGWPRDWGQVIRDMKARGETPAVLADLTMGECGLNRICPWAGCGAVVEDADDKDPADG